MAELLIDELTVGAQVGPISFGPVTTKQMVQWAAAADDFHEIHYDKDFALAQGLPHVVLAGPFKLALMGRLLMALVGPRGWISRMTCRYMAFDIPGTVLTVQGSVTALRPEQGEVDLELTVTNEQAVRTAAGTATIRLPRRS